MRFGLPQNPLSRMISSTNDVVIRRTEAREIARSWGSCVDVALAIDEEESERRPLLGSQQNLRESELAKHYFSINSV